MWANFRLQLMRLIKELYLTGFAIIFNSSRASGRTSGAVTVIAVIEWLILTGAASWVDISLGTRFLLSDANSRFSSKLIMVALFFALYFANYRVLVTHGHGVRFAHEFGSLKKARKILLVIGFSGIVLFTIFFFVGSRLEYRHFFNIDS